MLIRLAAILLAGQALLPAQGCSEGGEQFVRRFHDWYVGQVERSQGPAWAVVVAPGQRWLAPELRRMLKADLRAQARARGVIVGLDWDPFLGNQAGPARRYTFEAVADGVRVRAEEPEGEVLYRVRCQGQRWSVVDVESGPGRTLRGALAALRRAR